MAKRKPRDDSFEEPVKRRKRRSPEEIIQDLQAEIESVKSRAAAKAMKASPAHRAALTALRSLDRALEVAAQQGNGELRHVLAGARKPLADLLESLGVKLPKPRMPRGPRPKRVREAEEPAAV
jgi:hypothetical protein